MHQTILQWQVRELHRTILRKELVLVPRMLSGLELAPQTPVRVLAHSQIILPWQVRVPQIQMHPSSMMLQRLVQLWVPQQRFQTLQSPSKELALLHQR